jgi:hypothetical protein
MQTAQSTGGIKETDRTLAFTKDEKRDVHRIICSVMLATEPCSTVHVVLHSSWKRYRSVFKLHSSFLKEKVTAQAVAADFTQQRHGLDPRPDHVGFVANRVTLGGVFLRAFQFSIVSIIPSYSILIQS